MISPMCFLSVQPTPFILLKGPLLDRMELIFIEGYIEEEKLNIARRHLVPRQKNRQGLKDFKVEISDEVISELINYYTKEAGVRQLERILGSVFRKYAKKLVSNIEGDKPKKKTASKKTSSKTKKSPIKDFDISKKEIKISNPSLIEGMLGP